MQATNDREMDMPDLLAQEVLQLLNQPAVDMNVLKKHTENYMHLLNTMFQADVQQSMNRQDIQDALNGLIERLCLLTGASDISVQP